MVQLSKNEYERFVKSGFKPKFSVVKTSHGRFHYVAESDYEEYSKRQENNKKEN